ncbi:hypothetical protein BDR04DRAFT_720193 [Suillus decipiens]|nr:hypothetical protein BDR04DRAFT_720193 [Suillus decipiens]
MLPIFIVLQRDLRVGSRSRAWLCLCSSHLVFVFLLYNLQFVARCQLDLPIILQVLLESRYLFLSQAPGPAMFSPYSTLWMTSTLLNTRTGPQVPSSCHYRTVTISHLQACSDYKIRVMNC